MADVNVVNYRYNPFSNALEPISIAGETHVIPTNSPFTIRLKEVPLKESPSSVSLTIGGVSGVEVAATPAAGQFRCDYTTGADLDDNWNTGLIQFSAADAGKTVVASYKGMGSLIDKRIIDAINANINGLNQFINDVNWLRIVSITAGTIANGGTIPLPGGYTREQCKYVLWESGMSIGSCSEGVSVVHSVNQSNGAVTISTSYNYNGGYGARYDTVNYLCIGVR